MASMICIDDTNWQAHAALQHFGPDGKPLARGLIPRDYGKYPLGSYKGIPLFTRTPMTDDEIQAAIIRKNAEKSWLSDIRDTGKNGTRIPSTNQGGEPYCWNHSVTSCGLLVRARDGSPFAELSAYAGACIIKNWASQGGWGAQGAEWAINNGCPTSKTWPQQSKSRSNDTPAMRAEAALHKLVDCYFDLKDNDDRALATCLCNNDPVIVEYNWWSHSVCAVKLISWKPLKILIWNSWADSWSDNGMGELAGSKASPDSQTAVITARAA